MLCAARLITVLDMNGNEQTTVEVKPYSPGLDPPVWTIIEAESILDVIYENGTIRALTSEEKLARYKASKIELLKIAGREAVYTHAPEYKQANAALGIYSQEETELIRAWIQSVRSIVNEKEAAIENTQDKAAVDSVDISYGSIYTAAFAMLTPEQQQGIVNM